MTILNLPDPICRRLPAWLLVPIAWECLRLQLRPRRYWFAAALLLACSTKPQCIEYVRTDREPACPRPWVMRDGVWVCRCPENKQ